MENTNYIPISVFCEHHQLETNFIQILEDNDLITTITYKEVPCLQAENLEQLEKYVRLHRDLNVHPQDLDIIEHLIQKLEEAQTKLNDLQTLVLFYENQA